MTTARYPYLTNPPRGTMTADEVIGRLFPNEKYGTRVPANECTAWTDINGVQVRYMSTADAKQFWYISSGGKKNGMPMRAIARCPHCDKVVAASRINQHAIVHQGERERPFRVEYFDPESNAVACDDYIRYSGAKKRARQLERDGYRNVRFYRKQEG